MKTISILLGAAIMAAPITHVWAQTRVIDGDTLAIGDHHVRLKGIDAPELKQTCEYAPGKRYDCGRYARQTLVELIDGMPVQCTSSTKDKYGRWLSVCHTNKVSDLGAAMVRMGWALAYRHYETTYVHLEEQAKAERTGLWSGTFDKPWDWRHAHAGQQPVPLKRGNQ